MNVIGHAMNSIPVILLTGYLGSGKTTLLNHILRSPAYANTDIALIVNEFGRMGIDGQLVDKGQRPLFEINKGSMFCICTKTDFVDALQKITTDIHPDLVLIEATGIAETADLNEFVEEPHLLERLHIQANICVVDADNFTRIAAFLRAARRQVEWADGLVINKIDKVTPRDLVKLHDLLRTMNPSAPCVEARHGHIPPEFIDSLSHQNRSGDYAQEPPEAIVSASFQKNRPIDRQRFDTAINTLGDRLLRLKGNITFDTLDDEPRFVEFIGGRLNELPAIDNLPARTAFTAIAYNIEQQQLVRTFGDCWAERTATSS